MSDFDSVTARTQCSLAAIFAKLKLQVREDVEKRHALVVPPCNYGFKFIFDDTNAVAVREGIPRMNASVHFKLTATAIEVEDGEGRPRFKAVPTISDDRECRLRVNKQELELWQVRKLALEDLLFPE